MTGQGRYRSKPRCQRARFRPSAWPTRADWLHFWRNRLYVRYGWKHWPTSPGLRDMPEVFDRDGYDRDGYDRDGLDRDGYDSPSRADSIRSYQPRPQGGDR